MNYVIAPQRTSNEDWEGIRVLWTRFLENYTALKNGEMDEDEDIYRFLNIPGPSQYRAFIDLFGFFDGEEEYFKELLLNNENNIFYTYDLMDPENLTTTPILDFLENLSSPAYDAKGKNIIMSSGSFWKQISHTRKKAITSFGELYKKGASVSIYTQAKNDEVFIDNIMLPIKKASRFGLNNRIPMHFLKADMDYAQPELPHTESTMFRLTMFLDFQKLEPKLKDGKTRKDLSNFFDKMVKEAM